MPRIQRLVVVLAIIFGACSPAWAIIPFKKAFDEYYGKNNADIKKASDEAKCLVCHVGTQSKKNRNDYGKALSELLKKDNFKADRLQKEPEKVKEEIEAAFKKAEDMKTKDGKEKFGDRLKAGKLPGTPEEGK